MKLKENIIIILMLLLSLAVALFFFLLSAVSGGPDYLVFEIEKGTGFRTIAKELYEQKLIRSPKVFMAHGVLTGMAHQLKPGSYDLSSGSSTPEILNVIEQGPSIDVSVTLIEGMTLKDIDSVLAKNGILPAGTLSKISLKLFSSKYSFLGEAKSLEGFLFPDTYRFYRQSESGVVIEKILDNFAAKAQPLLEGCQKLNVECLSLREMSRRDKMLSKNEILTVASLLEKEAPDYKDRQMIAGIIYKRLQLGMALQIDATITYAKCAGKFLTCDEPKVFRNDLDFQSPYNTYLHNDLPPGPIGNPGLEAIKAALNPIKSDYLYYLSDSKTKRTIYSRTLEEHIDNRARYLTN